MALIVKRNILNSFRGLLRDLVKNTVKNISSTDLQRAGDNAVVEMKKLISKGISPIQGKGRFEGYKRASEKTGYPNTVLKRYPSKRKRPVNLKLTGDFLNDLEAKAKKQNTSVEIGYFDENSAKKEMGHRQGVNTQPKRPTIPNRSERFAKTIQQRLEKDLERALQKALNRTR